MRPLLFLDFDDVICLNNPYGGFDVIARYTPPDLWERLFDPTAVATLGQLVAEHRPQVVITSSWLKYFDQEALIDVLGKTGLRDVAASLHPKWDAPPMIGNDTRARAIAFWLRRNHAGEPFVILDDVLSGVGLKDSDWHDAGRVILCEENGGLHPGHLEKARTALSTPPPKRKGRTIW